MKTNLRWLLALVVPLALLGAACGDDEDTDSGATGTTAAAGDDTSETTDGASGDGGCASFAAPDDAPAVTIGAQDFGESAIVASIYEQCLAAAGFDASVQELGGFRDLVFEAFGSGDINLTPEYAASTLEFLNDRAGEATVDEVETTEILNGYLAEQGLAALTPSAARNTNGFAITQETADELGIATLSDLAEHPDLVLGAPTDCETNAGCLPGLLETYGVDLAPNFTPLEPAAIIPALEEGAIDVAVIFTTDAVAVQEGFVVLEDDQGLFKADNIVPVLTEELAAIQPLADLLDAVSAELDTEGVAALNVSFQVDREDPEDIALAFLEEHGLL